MACRSASRGQVAANPIRSSLTALTSLLAAFISVVSRVVNSGPARARGKLRKMRTFRDNAPAHRGISRAQSAPKFRVVEAPGLRAGFAVTREQLIVLGFIAVAFVLGWAARALTGDREERGPAEAGASNGDAPAPAASWSNGTAPIGGAEPGLAQEVSDALRSDLANRRMLDAVSPDRNALTDLELDLADWGFTYGVAWARASERASGGPGDKVAREALSAAEDVFRDYTDGTDWTEPVAARLPDES